MDELHEHKVEAARLEGGLLVAASAKGGALAP